MGEFSTFVQVLVESATNVVVLHGAHAGGPGAVTCQLRIAEDGVPVGGKRMTGVSSGNDPVWNEQVCDVCSVHTRRLHVRTYWESAQGIQHVRTRSACLTVFLSVSVSVQFAIRVNDPSRSQLEITLWDKSQSKRHSPQNYLGECVVNLGRLCEFSGQLVEHDFEIKCSGAIYPHGTTPQTNGTLQLVLRMVEGSRIEQELDLLALKSIVTVRPICFTLLHGLAGAHGLCLLTATFCFPMRTQEASMLSGDRSGPAHRPQQVSSLAHTSLINRRHLPGVCERNRARR
jgi:hypothetical protein